VDGLFVLLDFSYCAVVLACKQASSVPAAGKLPGMCCLVALAAGLQMLVSIPCADDTGARQLHRYTAYDDRRALEVAQPAELITRHWQLFVHLSRYIR
jgi:hypothetical protein